MTKTLAVAAAGGASEGQGRAHARVAGLQLQFALIAVVAFGLYWLSSFLLEARGGTTHFAADTWFYTELAKGDIFGRLADNYHLDRVFRFHPTTVLLAAGWMKLVEPLTGLISPLHLLKAMFALVGAIGVWAALWAFAAAVPQRLAVPLGAIYGSSLSVWYFSSIEESKIVTTTLIVLYFAAYLRLRTNWTLPRAALLTGILLVACLNEIVAGFVVIVPVVDTLVRRGLDLRAYRWIAAHALAGPVALAILELIMRARAGAAAAHAEGANHFSMLIYYITQNDYSPAALYTFAVRWLFFSIAAPSPNGSYYANPSINYGGEFEGVLVTYLTSPVSAGVVVLFGLVLWAGLAPRWRAAGLGDLTGVMLGMAAFAVVRGVFFLGFIPDECMLFSSSVTLAHLLLIAIPFAASGFPWKGSVLAGLAALLFVTNASFIVGQ
ncbi:MAG TPA: hypothetical protein VN524_05065 [Hyphomicrobiaceae bacterium]|jgi:hypothetical protein|nr:hypothetical protein [Hyphomicrobiaceae bacterium]